MRSRPARTSSPGASSRTACRPWRRSHPPAPAGARIGIELPRSHSDRGSAWSACRCDSITMSTRSSVSLRPPAQRGPTAQSVADHRIGEQLHAVDLEQRGRVAEPGDRGVSARRAAGRSMSSARCHLQPTTAHDGATASSKPDDDDSQPAPAADPPPGVSPRPGPPELARRPGRTRENGQFPASPVGAYFSGAPVPDMGLAARPLPLF